MAQLKELLDVHENTIITIFTNRIENLESKIANMQDENEPQKGEGKALLESIEFQNKTYEKMKKDIKKEKQKLENDYRNNEETQNLIQQNTEMKVQIAELENRHRRNSLRFMGMKETSGVESEDESQTKVKVLLPERLGLETEEITIEREEKEEGKKTIIAKFLNYRQHEKVLNRYMELKLWEDQIYKSEDFSEYTVEKSKILFKRAKEIRERCEFAKVLYNRFVSY